MKRKDWLPIIAVVAVTAILSFVLSNVVFGGKKATRLKVEVVTPITADFPLPNEKYFNRNSLNPTQLIQIGGDNNQTPFNGN